MNSLIAFIITLSFTLFATKLVIKVSFHLKLYDITDYHRKRHQMMISRLGGVSMFLGLSFSYFLFLTYLSTEIHSLLSAMTVLLLLGLKDDLLGGAKPIEKFVMQLIASIILIVYGNLGLSKCPFTESLGAINPICFQIFSVFIVVFIINSFNLIDGIDGLAGTIGLIVNICLSYKLFQFGIFDYALFGFIVCGATVGFLRYNVFEKKIFMGDSGAMMLGLVSIAMGFKFIQFNSSNAGLGYMFPGTVVFALLIVPFFDASRILLIRILQRKSLLTGDRNHIHHRLKDLGMTDLQVVLVLTTFTLVVTTYVLAFECLGHVVLIRSILIVSVLCNTLLTYLRGVILFKNYRLVDILLKDTLSI